MSLHIINIQLHNIHHTNLKNNQNERVGSHQKCKSDNKIL